MPGVSGQLQRDFPAMPTPGQCGTKLFKGCGFHSPEEGKAYVPHFIYGPALGRVTQIQRAVAAGNVQELRFRLCLAFRQVGEEDEPVFLQGIYPVNNNTMEHLSTPLFL